MDDFIHWLDYDAPEWVRFVFIPILSAFVMLVLILIVLIFMWTWRNGYWIAIPIIPVLGIWAVLHTYQKSKKERKDDK